MSDSLIIASVKDFLKNYHKIINSRYIGDSEFQEFKRFLIWKRKLLFILHFIILILGLTLLKRFFIFINLNITNSKVIFLVLNSSTNLTIGVALVMFSVLNLIEFYKTYKYLKLIRSIKKVKNFKWKKWQFIDLIFRKPLKLDKKEICVYIDKSTHYYIYLLLQYPTGHFAWLGINNWKSLSQKNQLIMSNGSERVFNDKQFRNEDHIRISMDFIFNEMKMSLDNQLLSPATIVGIRIRANTEEEQIIISKVSYN